MKRPEISDRKQRNTHSPVPQLQGKMKTGKKKANPIIAGTQGAELKVFHEKPISTAYPTLDNDLAVDNLQNDITLADLQDT